MDWTDDLIARLRNLWSQGLSTAEIGRQLSITKNAVVGKAHRLGLPPRPSPIRNKNAQGDKAAPAQRKPVPARKKKAKESVSESAEKSKKAVSAGKKTEKPESDQTSLLPESGKNKLPPVSSDKSKIEKEEKSSRKKNSTPREKKVQPDPAPEIKPIVRPKRVRDIMENSSKRGPSCQWPFGDPGTPDFHFCGAKPLPGKPYCAEHAAIAYVRIRDRREG